MVRRCLLVSGLTLLALAAFGQPPDATPRADRGVVVRIDGSNGVLPLAAALRRAFEAENEDVDVVLGAGLGSKARIEALLSGSIDIALASHGLDFTDLARRGLTAHRIAATPVVFAVHADVPLRNLAARELCDIYAGRVANWSALGGPPLPVRALLRPESEVDTEVVRAGLPCMKDLVLGPGVARAETTKDMVQALQDTPGGIGLTTSTAVRQSIVALRALSVDGVAPTPGNVAEGRYPLVRPAYFVTATSPAPAVRRFLEFVRDERGASVIVASGAQPVP